MRSEVADTVDEYISSEPAAVGRRLRAVRAAVRRAAPEAEESISYRIPAYKLKGALADDLAPYLAPRAKSTAHFRHDKPLPLDLIARMVKIRRAENLERAQAKALKAKRGRGR